MTTPTTYHTCMKLTNYPDAAPGSQERTTANVILGRTCHQAGVAKEAQDAFEAAIQSQPDSSPQEAYLRLGMMYLDQELFEYAADVFTQACATYPCGSSWLGLGVSYLRLGRLADADLVLSEAISCDPRNPVARAYMALVHILIENKAEACQVCTLRLPSCYGPERRMARLQPSSTPTCAKWACCMQSLESAEKYGLSDLKVMLEIGEAFATKGMFHESAALLRRVVAKSSQPNFHALSSLGEALLSCNELKAARVAWEHARAVATSEAETELSNSAIENLTTLLGDAAEEMIGTMPVEASVED
jgi:Flp pilus assembly protein TadD